MIAKLEALLAQLPPVTFKVVQLAVMDLLTLAWGVDLSHHADPSAGSGVYSSWLFFLAGLHGINLGAFYTAVKSPTTTSGGQTIVQAIETAEHPVHE